LLRGYLCGLGGTTQVTPATKDLSPGTPTSRAFSKPGFTLSVLEILFDNWGMISGRFLREAQGGEVAIEKNAQSFDHQVVVVALREAGDGDAANDTGSLDMQRE